MINFVPSKMKVAHSFIKNDKHVKLYLLDIASDNARPILRINVVDRFQQASPSPPSLPPSSQPQPLVDEEIITNKDKMIIIFLSWIIMENIQ